MKIRELLEKEFEKCGITEFVPYVEFTADTLSPALHRFWNMKEKINIITMNGLDIKIDYIDARYHNLYDWVGIASHSLLSIKIIDYDSWAITLCHEILHFCDYLSPAYYYQNEKISISTERYIDFILPNLVEATSQIMKLQNC